MRLIFNLFLGWWLTQHRGTAEGQLHPKPSISVNPSNVVAVGENINIGCKKDGNVKVISAFYLSKEINRHLVTIYRNETEHNEVEFHIFSAKQSDQGYYYCGYYFLLSEPSYLSESVSIFVREQSFPSPSISVIPNSLVVLGKEVTIQCKQEYYQTVQFNLFKKGALNVLANEFSKNKMTEFFITSAQEPHGGIYFCDYQLKNRHQGDNRYSKFSNKIYINITDPRVTEPDIYMEPKGQQMLDTNVWIYCQGPEDGLNYSLYKSTNFITSQRTKPNSSLAEFSISGVRLEHIGNYSCCYQLKNKPFVYSKLSDPLQLQVRDPSLTKPSIQIIKAEQGATEANVSIQCNATEPNLIFALLKSGEQIDYKAAEPGEKAVNFTPHWMKLEETQNYACQYHHKSSLFVWSVPSDPLERPSEGSVTKESNVPAKMYLSSSMEETPDEVSYAAINHNSQKIVKRPPTLYDTVPESCVYANVAKESTKENQ
ncbi:immunoglobulin superfamily member 1-like isoform X2 [Ahaetulla prasina]|uniref:immunoglobulin superfamily member 1-like isoform X2 n=1 Tax=Ahaetulla prasina TaxID=499056 RepID=UPI002649C6B4|nr:immunoglobulin superfamily member 1-like isoform X2 [Ahaetulla prasina]